MKPSQTASSQVSCDLGQKQEVKVIQQTSLTESSDTTNEKTPVENPPSVLCSVDMKPLPVENCSQPFGAEEKMMEVDAPPTLDSISSVTQQPRELTTTDVSVEDIKQEVVDYSVPSVYTEDLRLVSSHKSALVWHVGVS